MIADRPVSPAAMRMRLAQQRRREGKRVIELELLPAEIDAVVAAVRFGARQGTGHAER